MIRTPVPHRLELAAATALVTASLTTLAAAALPEAWQTVAERSGFQATSSYDETIELLQRLDQVSPAIELDSFGRSGEGRPLPLVVVSADRAFTRPPRPPPANRSSSSRAASTPARSTARTRA
jgi:hypothetical protein